MLEEILEFIKNNGTAIILIGIGLYLKSYISKKADNLATREEFNTLNKQLRETTKLTEEIKSKIQRSEIAKSEGATSILSKMADVTTWLSKWQILAYFREVELKEGQSIEVLGRQDLNQVAHKIVETSSLTNQYDIYFSDDLKKMLAEWGALIYQIIFDYEAAYKTSIDHHKNLNASNKDRFIFVNNIIDKNIKIKTNKASDLKKKIYEKLREELII